MNKQSIIEAAEKKYPDGENMAQIKRAAYIAGATDHPCAGRWVKINSNDDLPISKPGHNPIVRWQQKFGGNWDAKCSYLLVSTVSAYLEMEGKRNIEYLDESPSPESIESADFIPARR